MPDIRLIPIDTAVEAALSAGVDTFAARYGISLGSHLESTRAVVRGSLTFLTTNPRPDPWGFYLTADPADGGLVGGGGFKHGPDANGAVEIAYYTVPDRQGLGYATTMAADLFALAVSSDAVRVVVAHTLPERNASGRVLEKAGFRHVGETDDPDDGRVWRWERPANVVCTDDEFLAEFEAGSMPKSEWTHAAHVRVGWLCLCRHPFDDALARVRVGIRRYNAGVGTPDAAYHDTVTAGHMRLIHTAGVDPTEGFRDFASRNPTLLDRTLSALLAYYSRELLFSDDARQRFVEPDIRPLPEGPPSGRPVS